MSGSIPSGPYTDLRWTGAPADMAPALASLGHPDFSPEHTPLNSAVAAFGPVGLEMVAGRNVMFALIRVTAGTELTPPAGVFTEPGRVHEGATGRFFEVPREVTNFQARAVLMQLPSPTGAASLFHDINAALLAGRDSGDPQGMMAWQAWEQANDFTRHGALVNSMAASFGLTEQQLDDLFIAASQIEA